MLRLSAAALLVLLWGSPAAAQQVDGNGIPFRPWDLHGAFGFHVGEQSDVVSDPDELYDNWEPAWAVSFDVGRYWTSHWKTEVGVSRLSSVQVFRSETGVAPTGERGDVFVTTHIAQTQMMISGTYQFLDNTFAHPYVSAGARVGILDRESFRSPYLYYFDNTVYRAIPIPPEQHSDIAVRVRPFVAVGSKSYFSERVFIRPEMIVAFNPSGLSQFGLRLGMGIDF
jgi:hypothetical protein